MGWAPMGAERWPDPGAGEPVAVGRPGWERGNRRVRLRPAPAEKVPFRSYDNPGSGRPRPRRLPGDPPPPRHMLGGPQAGIKLSPLARGGVTHARGACQAARGDRGRITAPHGSSACPQTSWLGLSHARLRLRSSLHRGMWPKPEPNAFPGSCPPAPTEAGGDKGGQEVPPAAPWLQRFRGGCRRLPSPWHLHLPTLQDAAPTGPQGSPALPVYPEPRGWVRVGPVIAPSVPNSLLSPAQGAPTSSTSPGARGTVLRGCSPGTLRLSPAGAKRVPAHGGVWGLCWVGTGSQAAVGGARLCARTGAGWAKGLGMLQDSLALAPWLGGGPAAPTPGGLGVPDCHWDQAGDRQHPPQEGWGSLAATGTRLGTSSTHPGRAGGPWLPPAPGTSSCQTLAGTPRPSGRHDGWRQHPL